VIRAVVPAEESKRGAKPVEPEATPAPKPRHPAGERANKQKSALEENLKKWLAGKK
jgi:hypothetical protein